MRRFWWRILVLAGATSLGVALGAAGARAEDGALEHTGRSIDQGAHQAGQTIQDTAQRTGEALKRGFQETGQAIERGAHETGEFFERTGHQVGRATGLEKPDPPRAAPAASRHAPAAPPRVVPLSGGTPPADSEP